MRRAVAGVTVCLLLAGATPVLSSPEQGRGKKQKHERAVVVRDERSRSDAVVNVVFAPAEVVIIRDHYAPRYRNLPPGLRKKVARGGQLPPGWQKKFEIFPVAVERQLQPLPQGYRRGIIDGHAVIFNSRTNVIVDVAVLF